MKYIATLNDNEITLEVDRQSPEKLRVVSGDNEWLLDICTVGPHHYSVVHDGQSYDLRFSHGKDETTAFWGDQSIRFNLEEARLAAKRKRSGGDGNVDGPQEIKAMMPGKIVSVKAQKGDAVTKGQGVVVLEAMKMENELSSPKDGTVVDVKVSEGQSVENGDVLIIIE